MDEENSIVQESLQESREDLEAEVKIGFKIFNQIILNYPFNRYQVSVECPQNLQERGRTTFELPWSSRTSG